MNSDEMIDKAFNSTTEDAENIVINSNKEGLQLDQKYNFIVPSARIIAPIDVKNLQKIQISCENAKIKKFSWEELFLGIASLLFGVFLEALVTQISFENTLVSVFSYIICPTVGAGLVVAFCFIKRENNLQNEHLADKILEYISDSIEEVNNNEYE